MAVSEAQKRATAKYEKENYDKVLVRFSKGTKKRIERQSESVNAYIIRAVIERLEADEDEELQDGFYDVQNAEIKPKQTETREPTKDPKKVKIKLDTTPQQEEKTEEEKMAELQRLLDAKKAEEWERARRKRKTEPEESEKPDAYTDEDGNFIEYPRQYLIDMARQKQKRNRETLEQIHGKEYVRKLYGEAEDTSLSEAQTAPISSEKEEPEEIPEESQNTANKADAEPVDMQEIMELFEKRKTEEREKAEAKKRTREERIEKEKAEHEAECRAMVERLRDGVQASEAEDAEKEALRRESINKAMTDY